MGIPAQRALVLRAGVTVGLAVTLDVSLSLLRGYVLRSDVPLLLLVDAAMVALVAVPSLLLLDAAARKSRGAWAPVCAAAWAAACLPRLHRIAVEPLSVVPELLLLLPLTVLLIAETRQRLPRPRAWSATVVLAVCGVVLSAAVNLPLPGRSLLAAPDDGAGTAATAEKPNLLMIVLDTVRADHLGLYGYGRPTSPFLDRFVERATVFERAVAAANWTLPSHASLFTGLYAESHGADMVDTDSGAGIDVSQVSRLKDPMRVQPLSDEATTLAELTRSAGLETAAICGNVTYLYSLFNLDQGFDTYVDAAGNDEGWQLVGFRLADALGARRYAPYRRALRRNNQADRLAGEVNRLALEWLEPRRDRRFFLFLNYMDAHDPNLPLSPYSEMFSTSDEPRPEMDRDAILSKRRGILPEERAVLVDAYDAEIRHVDDELSELVTRLEAWGVLERTVVLIVADHGESFGENHDLGHGNNVRETEIRVPMLLRLPGQRTGERVWRPVHHVDVLPTVLDALAIPRPAGLEGVSLREDTRRLPVVSLALSKPGLEGRYPRYSLSHTALYRDPWKLIAHSDGLFEVYDLGRRPHETVDLSAVRPDVLSALAEELRAFKAEVKPAYPPSQEILDEESLRRLRALGYVN